MAFQKDGVAKTSTQAAAIRCSALDLSISSPMEVFFGPDFWADDALLVTEETVLWMAAQEILASPWAAYPRENLSGDLQEMISALTDVRAAHSKAHARRQDSCDETVMQVTPDRKRKGDTHPSQPDTDTLPNDDPQITAPNGKTTRPQHDPTSTGSDPPTTPTPDLTTATMPPPPPTLAAMPPPKAPPTAPPRKAKASFAQVVQTPPSPVPRKDKIAKLRQFPVTGLPNRYNTIFTLLTPYEIDADDDDSVDKSDKKKKSRSRKKRKKPAKDFAAEEVKAVLDEIL
jgi:hypothetical protein